MKTVQRFSVIVPALVCACAILFLGCPQKIDGGQSGGGMQSGPDPNLRIEGTVLKGWNETPPTVLNVPAGVTEIAASAFYGCTSLTGVNLPANLKKIGADAFRGCTGLTGTVSLPAKLEMVGDSAFRGCTGITALDFSACTQSFVIDDNAFTGCTELTGQVGFSSGLTEIKYEAFKGCTKVSGFDFSQCTQLTSIGTRAFADCTAAKYKIKTGSPIWNLLLNSQSDITASQISKE